MLLVKVTFREVVAELMKGLTKQSLSFSPERRTLANVFLIGSEKRFLAYLWDESNHVSKKYMCIPSARRVGR